MHLELHPRFADTPEGQAAQNLTKACVHCGFCLTTCPTYQDSRDERDSPRGRIYLIKHLLESGEATQQTRLHLDRCLTCRNCETTCPSGMEYGQLLDIGRDLIEQEAPRAPLERLTRKLLRFVFLTPVLFKSLLSLGQLVRPVLPTVLRNKIPPRQFSGSIPTQQQARKMLVLEGCVQNAATPKTNAAARRILDKLGISLVAAPRAGCCGALNYHLAAQSAGLDNMRRNIDAWWPDIEAGAEAIISSASGCGAMLIDYGRALAHDPQYAVKAQRVAQLSRDLGQVLLAEDLQSLKINTEAGCIAVHTPCSMAHGLKAPDLVRDVLSHAGFALSENTPGTLCCGSAGTYSILQAGASERIREVALAALETDRPTVIATANVGCQLHLQGGSDTPVIHWIELLDQA